MQRVSALLPSWDRSKSTANTSGNDNRNSKHVPGALDKVFGWTALSNRTSTPAAAVPARFGRETYWPSNLDKECDKAARILKSFCTDGFFAQDADSRPTSPKSAAPATNLVSKKIPARIIQNAIGLAIFSCMRSGLWMSGSGGSGILIARKADGTWSPPAGILLHTSDLAFVIGVDIYDCILVINNVAVLEMFTRSRVTLGTDVSLSVGPLVTMGSLDDKIRWDELNHTVLTYLKARGQHQGVPLDGSLVVERGNENERFYSGQVNILDILAGNVPKNVPEMKPLFDVIKAAEGRTDFDAVLMKLLSQQPAPGDAVIETPSESLLSPLTSPMQASFGIPDRDDPDPFGVLALEMAGAEIREAGSRLRPNSSQFEFNPSPTSPMFGKFNRQSVDTYMSRSNRGSYVSSRTQATVMTDACTQTDGATPETTISHANSEDGMDNISENLPVVMEPDEIDYTKIDTSAIDHFNSPVFEEPPTLEDEPLWERPPQSKYQGVETDAAAPSSVPAEMPEEQNEFDADDEDEEDDEEEPIICEVATASSQPARTAILSSQVTQVIQAKGALVTIGKRVPPPLPPRSSARTSRDVTSLRSPLRTSFQSADFQVDSEFASIRSPLRMSVQSADLRNEEVQPNSSQDDIAEDAESAEAARAEKVSAKTLVAKRVSAFEIANVRSHQKNASSVRTPGQLSRWSVDSVTPTQPPQTTEPTSSAEESEREPKTPRPEDDFRSRGIDSEKTDLSDAKDLALVSHHQESNTIAVA